MKPLHPFTLGAGLASPGGRRGKLSILIFHRVLERPDPLLSGLPDVARFRWQMKLLADHFRVLPLREAARRLQDGSLPARAACITFDDGYADNYTTALPALQSFGLPATFFVATAFLDGGRMFNDTLIELARRLPEGRHDFGDEGLGTIDIRTLADRRALIGKLIGHFKYQPPAQRLAAAEALARRFRVDLPDDLMMSTDQLRALHRSPDVEIGGHTRSHPILTRLDDDEALDEIRAGKERLETLLEAPVRSFAYPNGRPEKDYADRHAQMVRDCGFELAVSTAPVAAAGRHDPFQLPRYTPWDNTPTRFMLRMLRTLAGAH
ncbi:polysaccharide deacetylase family protein [Pseudothauera rhizosphaerae]|uniref:Polysaccharide deacetylase family protein n=1 Tax=Pseudothauera rhizosphaerae TaxID=2565932 RepID=A0A4S4APJ5_9RHOO|nr:polysaccharide deacetylase family protein [Pseudothauera rhizosphaerae]THF61606.1 polysaccharide deacetylase family protein [Pseudothauera rhizosphaerae]